MKKQIVVSVLAALVFTGCGVTDKHEVVVDNNLDFDRIEVVSVKCADLQSMFGGNDLENVLVFDPQTSQYLVSQLVDDDQDGEPDEFLFQARVKAHSSSTYRLESKENASDLKQVPAVKTFSRFVPERIGDYAWENDKVAFRTYGPEAERLVKDGEPGGTLSSGIDLWLKRVDYSIIDKWYSGNLQQPGYYHKDHGEGYDPYHVGSSRGTGGTGIWENDSLYISDNFTAYRTICTGPLRTTFELDYAPWSQYEVKETKQISLDLGSNFSKFDISISGDIPNDSYTVGITLHEGEGSADIDKDNGAFSHWELIDGVPIGEGIVIDPAMVADGFTTNSNVPDQKQLLVTTHARSKLTYYAGFAWTKSGQVEDEADWAELLQRQAKIIANPLVVQVH
ncbi:DUF4861 family protein [Mangrovibacterium diazotrophicum]|uniref:Uncharacterized protein DUF4861 n=1 Tax=Mangrovibacterium diazotrophicum TaxID=1261403 RepID=A0A419VYP5_9BACT|nr:DUF4861 family protein [Mangrovibacterium diazotrophicum]RKD88284.1 uncharacterized protein DUF4861 [Mangrovibacterium diazotrophicum]